MTTAPLIIAIPSKGRLKEQVEDWLADCGLALRAAGGARGYSASLDGFDDVQVRLASASDIASQLHAGEVHLGVTGEDLLRETANGGAAAVLLLTPLGFGRADLVVAAPRSWVDVETMADVDDVAHLYLARTGRRLRVATKYLAQTRTFFARHGIADYRLVESGGATEGAPAAGAAELVVDITTTGATLAANGLKVLAGGLILKSQAHLAAGVAADWTDANQATCRRLLAIFGARARAKRVAGLTWPAAQEAAARAAVAPFIDEGAPTRAHGALVERVRLFAAAAALGEAGVGPVSVEQPAYVFQPTCPEADRLALALQGQAAAGSI
ncbi:MAG TPA: ATP phosphoribosyltransferase [Caulobacteraceae bacterium]|nr:ATP phosphoribosyltransferase [Caulobacteraceae bacterium]